MHFHTTWSKTIREPPHQPPSILVATRTEHVVQFCPERRQGDLAPPSCAHPFPSHPQVFVLRCHRPQCGVDIIRSSSVFSLVRAFSTASTTSARCRPAAHLCTRLHSVAIYQKQTATSDRGAQPDMPTAIFSLHWPARGSAPFG